MEVIGGGQCQPVIAGQLHPSPYGKEDVPQHSNELVLVGLWSHCNTFPSGEDVVVEVIGSGQCQPVIAGQLHPSPYGKEDVPQHSNEAAL